MATTPCPVPEGRRQQQWSVVTGTQGTEPRLGTHHGLPRFHVSRGSLWLTEKWGVESRVEDSLELCLPHLLQHTQSPHQVHLQSWLQARQRRPQPLVHLVGIPLQ